MDLFRMRSGNRARMVAVKRFAVEALQNDQTLFMIHVIPALPFAVSPMRRFTPSPPQNEVEVMLEARHW